MEITPKDVGISPKDRSAMTDADTAIYLIDETFIGASGRDVKVALGTALDALKKRERRLPKDVLSARQRSWTERRLRALWNREARRIEHYEIQDLTAVAVEEARRERQYLEARQERLAALVAAADAGDLGPISHVEGEPVRGLDLPRTGFTEADERASQEHGWGR